HLLLPAGERAGALVAALDQVGEQTGDEIMTRLALAFGECEVLRNGEAGEDFTVFGNIADAALHDLVRGKIIDPLALEQHLTSTGDESEDPAQRRCLTDTISPQHSGDTSG